MKHEDTHSAITIALGGIGLRGALNIGFLQALAEASFPIKRIVATGVSAMIGAHFALGRDPGELLPRIIHFFEENRHAMWELEQLGGLSQAEKRMAARSMSYFLRESLFCHANITRLGVFEWDLVEANLSRLFGDLVVEDLKIPFAVSVIDIERGKETLLNKGPILDLVRAGIAFPGLFPPAVIAGCRYVSSATYCAFPICSLSDADRPIVALSFPQRQEVRRPRSMIEVLARVDEIRGNVLTQQALSKADRVISLGPISGNNWSSFRRLDKAIPLVKQACAEEISRWKADDFQ